DVINLRLKVLQRTIIGDRRRRYSAHHPPPTHSGDGCAAEQPCPTPNLHQARAIVKSTGRCLRGWTKLSPRPIAFTRIDGSYGRARDSWAHEAETRGCRLDSADLTCRGADAQVHIILVPAA